MPGLDRAVGWQSHIHGKCGGLVPAQSWKKCGKSGR